MVWIGELIEKGLLGPFYFLPDILRFSACNAVLRTHNHKVAFPVEKAPVKEHIHEVIQRCNRTAIAAAA
jgi:hypothetical protein